MEITTEYIEKRFQYFNQLCFGGRLVLPPIRLSRSRRTLGQVRFMRRHRLWGKTKFYGFEFVISSLGVSFMDAEQVDDIILHEMIHFSILSDQLQDTSAHGKLFRSEMLRINRDFNRHITISYRSSTSEIAKERNIIGRKNVVATLLLADGSSGMMVVARTRICQIWRQLKQVPTVVQIKFFVTDNPFFNRFPRCITLKYHPMSRSELLSHLEDAQPLEM